MEGLASWSLLALAGFVLFPAVSGVYAWSLLRPPGLRVTMTVWAVLTSMQLVTVAVLLSPDLDLQTAGVWLLARHLTLNAVIVCGLVAMAQLSGSLPRVLFGVTLALILVRVVLWFTTDLVFAHGFTPEGNPLYGPLRNPLALTFTVLVVAQALFAVTRRPWQSEVARRALLFAMLPSVLISALSVVPGPAGEYLLSVSLVLAQVAIALIYLLEFRREHRRIARLAEREARLATFGTHVLGETTQVPEVAAVSLVEEVLGARCSYEERRGTEALHPEPRHQEPPESDLTAEVDVTQDCVTVPVKVAGRPVAVLRARMLAPADDDVAFVQAVGTVLSAALEREHAERMLHDDSLHDRLTGLPNYALLKDRLARLLADPAHSPAVVICCDIRDLKGVNDELGRDAGDTVISVIAGRLAGSCSARGTVARIGGDQFIVVEPDASVPGAETLARTIMDRAGEPIDVADRTLQVRLRLGYTVTGGDGVGVDSGGSDVERVVRDAEMAVMLAKADDVTIRAFSQQLRSRLVGRRTLASELEAAVAGGGIEVYYQPIVDLGTGTVRAVESLARWRRKSGEPVPPEVFVRLAEQIGAIHELQGVVFDRALGQLEAWSQHAPCQELGVSLNLSPVELVAEDFAGTVERLLLRHGIAPARITLEVTESGLQQAPEAAARRLAAIRQLGVALSLDDFGTGYSTLTRLVAFPVDELKIDRQFTGAPRSAEAIIPAVIDMAHGSGLTVVAEGIETEEQRQFLLAHGCDQGQGTLFSRPLPANELLALLLAWQRLPAGA